VSKVIGSADLLSNVVVPSIKRCLRSDLDANLSDGAFAGLSFTADSWQDFNQNHFVGITVHFVDEAFKLRSRVLDLIRFSGSQTALALEQHISMQFQKLCPERFQSRETLIFGGTVDGAKNYQKAVADFLGIENRVHCLCHTLNLAVEDVINRVRLIALFFIILLCISYSFDLQEPWKALMDYITKVKSICNNVEHRSKFQSHCSTLGVGTSTFVNPCDTRWIYWDGVLERYCRLGPALLALRDEHAFKNDTDVENFVCVPKFTQLKFIQQCLHKVNILNKHLQEQDKLIITRIPSLVNQLLSNIDELMSSRDYDAGTVQFAFDLHTALDHRLGYINTVVNPILLTSAVDPRYCELPQVTTEIRTCIYHRISQVATLIDSDLEVDFADKILETVIKAMKHFKASICDDWSTELIMNKFWDSQKNSMNFTNACSSILDVVLATTLCHDLEITMPFRFVARYLLSAQPTSSMSESTFSLAKLQQSDRRTRLSDETLNCLTEIHSTCRSWTAQDYEDFAHRYVQHIQSYPSIVVVDE
jgi:hypothetical protein